MSSRSSLTCKMIANGLLIGLVGCGERTRQVDIRTDDLVKERNAVLAAGIRTAPELSPDSYPEGEPFPKDTPELNEPSTVDPAADELAFTGRSEAESEADAIIKRIQRLADTPANAEPLTLDYAIAFAQQNATEYTGAEETYLLSALSLIVQEHLFEPRFFNETTIDAGEGIGRYDAALRVANDFGVRQRLPYGGEVTARFLAGLTRNIDDASTENGVQNAGFIIEGRLPLLRGGGIVARESLIQAQRNLVYASRSFEIFRRDFYVAIVTDYLGLVLQLQAITNAEGGLALNRQVEELLTALVETGRSQPFEADEARKDTLDAVDDLASRQEAYKLSLDRFKVRIGMDPERPMVIIPTEIQLPIPEVDRDQAIRYAMEYRLDLQTNRDQLEDARRQIDLAENGLLPDFDLTADFRVGGNDVLNGVDLGDTRASGGVFLSLPLDRVDESVALRQAQVRFVQDERLYSRSLDDAAVSVRQSIRDIDRAQFSILLQERSVEIAKNRIASIDAAPDRATARDRTTAVAGLRTAEDRRDTSKRDLQVAVLKYLNAAGILRLTPEGRLQPLPNMPVGEVIGQR